MAHIKFENVNKSYGDNLVVDQLNLEINNNDFVVLVGPSGCGKSTTLRMIAGLEQLSSGNLYIGDDLVNEVPPVDRGVAMVFQDYALYPHMTVYENMAFSMRLKSWSNEEIDLRVRDAAKMLDLEDYLDRKPKALSGGQRQRVAMGRAIVKRSKIFLFDEPLSNLDAKLRSQMRIEIKKFHLNADVTSVYVTHDQLEAMTLADRLVVMKDGKIEQIGSPIEVYEYPRTVFVATFIGSPGMNLFDITIERSGDWFYIIGENGSFRFPLPESKVNKLEHGMKLIMGIRPSDIFISTDDDNISGDWKSEGMIDLVEVLGKNAYLNLRLGPYEFLSEIMGRSFPKVNDKVPLSFNLSHIHLFDCESQLNITLV